MKKLNKKAFTLIELLVVIAVVGILALLGAPRFLGYSQRAELTRIQHDVKVMEQEVGTMLINKDDEFNKWENNSEDFNQLIQANNLFEKEGAVKQVEDLSIDKTYKVIPEKYKDKINTKLKGTFYANSGGEVYYEHVKPGIEGLIEKGYIPIATAEELDSIRRSTSPRTYGKGTQWETEDTGGLDKRYVQVAYIDLSSFKNWTPIGATSDKNFTGIYDGSGHNITGLTISSPETDYVGLFGHTKGAIIRNVGLIGNKVTGVNYVGGLVGFADQGTKISNSYATGSVEGTGAYYVGGLVGRAYVNTKISNSYATGSVSGNTQVGGLVGRVDSSTISNSYSIGEVTGSGEYVGGLVGVASGGSDISNSYATGSVTVSDRYAGGLVGYASSSTIENSYATGSVEGAGIYVGGFVGRVWNNTKIINSYATGEVTGGSWVGGFVGWANRSIIENSYATGSVEGSGDNVGGLVGRAYNDNKINNSYWDTKTTGQTSSVGGGIGKTTKEMMKQATYLESGWNFETIWEIDNGKDYPKLR